MNLSDFVELQAHIEGSIVELLRCLPGATPDMCEVESETSSKSGSKLIDANKWNYIYSQFVDNSVSEQKLSWTIAA